MSLVAESLRPLYPPQPASKRRVVVNIVAALLVTVLEITMFTLGMRHTAPPLVAAPIAVRLVMLQAPAPPNDALPMIETTAPTSPPPSQPEPPPLSPSPPQPPSPEAIPMIKTPQAAAEPPPPPPLPAPTETEPPMPVVPNPKPPVPPRRDARQARPSASPLMRATPSAAATPNVAPAQVAPSPSGGGTMGARAIYKPMPDIPEELRHHPMTLFAMARFRVAADGNATVELIEPTASPLLNRALLVALHRWRFFPAMNHGRSVASMIDIRIPIEIR